MQLSFCIAVAVVQAGSYNSDSTPSPGTSICCRCGPEKQKREREREKVGAEKAQAQAGLEAGLGRERERAREEASNIYFGGPLNCLCEDGPSGLPLANHLASSGFGLIRALPCVHVHPSARMVSSIRVSGKVTGCTMVCYPPPFSDP